MENSDHKSRVIAAIKEHGGDHPILKGVHGKLEIDVNETIQEIQRETEAGKLLLLIFEMEENDPLS